MKNGKCLVVMYHYVRNMPETLYPGIKGRLVADFMGQLDYLCRYHEPLRIGDFLKYCDGDGNLPSNGFYLTFDDGLRDHYEIVFPELQKRGIEGAFFPHLEPLLKGRVSSVQKLQFLINNLDFDIFYREFQEAMRQLFPAVDSSIIQLPKESDKEGEVFNRFDETRIAYFKKAVTLDLPTKVKDVVLDHIFPKHFGHDLDFIKELYMSWSELSELRTAGMMIGGHTITHPYLSLLSFKEQLAEINGCMDMLNEKLNHRSILFAYPYGAYNQDTLQILMTRGCRIAFTTNVGVTCERRKPLEIDRLDTNDLPLSNRIESNVWSLKVGIKHIQ